MGNDSNDRRELVTKLLDIAEQLSRLESEPGNKSTKTWGDNSTTSSSILGDEKRCKRVIEELPVIIYEIDPEGYFTFVNNSIRLLGYEPEELMGKHFSVIIHPEDLKYVSRASVLPKFKGKITGDRKSPKLFDERRTGERCTKDLEIRLIPKEWDQEKGDAKKKIALLTLRAEVTASGHYDSPVSSESKTFLGTVGIIRDITEKKEAEAEIKKLSSAVNQSIDGVAIFDFDFKITYVNQAFATMHQYNEDEMLGLDIQKLHHMDYQKRLQKTMMATEKDGSWQGELVNIRKDNTSFPTYLSTTLIRDDKGAPFEILTVYRDITDRKRAEKRIKKALIEKELLLKEIHHRTKNNLQVISSLLKLQSGYIDDEQIRDIFNETRNRIKSMALVHEKLYRSENLAIINFEEYIQSLSSQLFSSYSISPSRINFEVQAEKVFLGVDTAIPCGLIINELVSNALEHAFPDNREGKLSIELELVGKDNFVMIVQDNGIGFPEELDYENTSSLGMQIVTTLVKQLKGTIELGHYKQFESEKSSSVQEQSTKGTAYLIKFKKIQYMDGRR